MQQEVNIEALVNNNPLTKLSSDYNSEIIKTIKESFKEEDQRLFVANYFCYLNYDSRKDFVIELRSVWKWLGYTRTGDCKVVLVKNFEENKDYKIEFFASEVSVAKTKSQQDHEKEEEEIYFPEISGEIKNENFAPEISGAGQKEEIYFSEISEKLKKEKAAPETSGAKTETRGGHNKEKILLTVNCFKKLCLVSRTDKAKKIHDYYIELEDVVNQFVSKQTKDLETKLLINSKKLTDITKESHKTIIKSFKNKNVTYVIRIAPYLYKYGFTEDMERRLAEHRSEFGHDIVLVFIYETVYNKDFETMIKTRFGDYATKRKFKKRLQTELIQLDDSLTYEEFERQLNEMKEEVGADSTAKVLNENTELKARLQNIATPDVTQNYELRETIYNLKEEIYELKLENQDLKHKMSMEEHPLRLENQILKAKIAELESKSKTSDVEIRKIELREKELEKRNDVAKMRKKSTEREVINGIEMKFCSGIVCGAEGGKWLELSEFGKASQTKDGYKGDCKVCRNTIECMRNNKQDNKMSEEELAKSKERRSMKLRAEVIDGKKTCIKCNESLDLSDFSRAGGKYVTGEDKYRSECKGCYSKYRTDKNKLEKESR